MTGFAGCGAFGLVCLVFGWGETLSRRIQSVEEVTRGLNLPVLGTVPHIPRRAREAQAGRQALHGYWHSMLSESVDAIRTLLIRNSRTAGTRVIMLASPMPNEGKTSLACQLARSLARSGRKTLFVDCDLRCPQGHELFGVPLSPGFSELLQERVSFDQAIRATSTKGLSVMTAGEFVEDLIPLLARDEMGEIFRRFKSEFEFVIIDTAPALPINDSLLIGQHVDGVIIAIRQYASRFSEVEAVQERYKQQGIPVLGAIGIGLDSGLIQYSLGVSYAHEYHRSRTSSAPPLASTK
jgi:capsular exopolysaccharide synthesis family protein